MTIKFMANTIRNIFFEFGYDAELEKIARHSDRKGEFLFRFRIGKVVWNQYYSRAFKNQSDSRAYKLMMRGQIEGIINANKKRLGEGMVGLGDIYRGLGLKKISERGVEK